jgi:hypothetical protein
MLVYYLNMNGYCVVDACGRLAYAKGYCKRHYMQTLRHGHLTLESERGGPQKCEAPNCVAEQSTGGHCGKHARQIKVYGKLTPEREYMTGRTTCSEPDCQEAVRSKGLCAKHYNRKRRDGTLP